jgi:hypothetical protein
VIAGAFTGSSGGKSASRSAAVLFCFGREAGAAPVPAIRHADQLGDEGRCLCAHVVANAASPRVGNPRAHHRWQFAADDPGDGGTLRWLRNHRPIPRKQPGPSTRERLGPRPRGRCRRRPRRIAASLATFALRGSFRLGRGAVAGTATAKASDCGRREADRLEGPKGGTTRRKEAETQWRARWRWQIRH